MNKNKLIAKCLKIASLSLIGFSVINGMIFWRDGVGSFKAIPDGIEWQTTAGDFYSVASGLTGIVLFILYKRAKNQQRNFWRF